MNNNTNNKEKILECALQLFSEKGYESVGIAELTERAGITKPTLYYFFQSKEGVFKAILEKYYKDFNERLKEACTYVP
ncbi:MAG: TetR/AcrR family transcriptional regulator, partial [Lachnospiraceae bacterium]